MENIKKENEPSSNEVVNDEIKFSALSLIIVFHSTVSRYGHFLLVLCRITCFIVTAALNDRKQIHPV